LAVYGFWRTTLAISTVAELLVMIRAVDYTCF